MRHDNKTSIESDCMFPTLYHQTDAKKQDKRRMWSIDLKQDDTNGWVTITRTYGVEYGAMTTSQLQVKQGKNIGKSNETSVFEQARLQAESLWKKQQEKGYTICKDNNVNSCTPRPMLAQPMSVGKIQFPCRVQPKLDGVRLLLNLRDMSATSRTGKSLDECASHLKPGIPFQNVVLDGELYLHDVPFDEISGVVRTKKALHNERMMEYHVYDLVDDTLSFEERHSKLNEMKFNNPYIKHVPTYACEDEDALRSFHDQFVKTNFEGIMIRNNQGNYKQGGRTYDLQKHKYFKDDEFKIVNVKEADGNDKGTAIVQCETTNGALFWVRPKGSRAYRKDLLDKFQNVIGKRMTVKYQNLTEQGVPRFPVGVSIRDYE